MDATIVYLGNIGIMKMKWKLLYLMFVSWDMKHGATRLEVTMSTTELVSLMLCWLFFFFFTRTLKL